jgi:hypothetical protein
MPITHMPKLWNGFLKKEEKSDSDEENELAVTPAASPTREPEQFPFDFDVT